MTLKVEVDSSDIPKAVQNIQRLERQYKMLEKALYSGTISVQQHSRAIQQVDNKILQLSRSMDTTTAAVQRSYKANRQFEVGVQQAGYQVGDFFVQVASGTSPMIAFTQQATQLVGFFGGPWGAVFGAALSVVGALGVAFLAASGNARTFQDSLQELESTTSRLRDISSSYTIDGLEKQKEKYGELSAAVMYHIETLRKFEMQKAFEDTQQVLATLYDQLDDGMLNFYTTAGNLQSMFGVTAQEAEVLAATLAQARDAADFEGQLSALIQVRDQIIEIEKAHGPLKGEQAAFYGEVLKSVDAMMLLRGATPPEGWLDAAIRGAQSLATAFWDAAAAKAAATGAANLDAAGNPIIPGLPGKKPRGAPTGTGGIDWGLPPSTGGGGGGGAARDPLEELRNRIALEKELLGVSGSMATVLKALGKDRARYSQAEIEAVAAEIEANKRKEEALKQQQNLYSTVQSSMENAFMATITGTESVADAFRSMAYEIVKELYKVLVVQKMVGSFNATTGTGSGIVGFLGKLTGLESGGSMMQGRPYLVGERGPELVIPRHSGTVVNANQTASVLSGSAPITVQNTITVTGSDAAMVRAEVAKMIPQITNATKAAVIDARLRGGQMKAAFS